MAQPGKSTRERLKRAACRLIAERGIDSVTIRMILAEAEETNGASLNYYFGSKNELIREIAADLFCFLDAQWRRGLEELRASKEKIAVRDLLTLIVKTSTLLDAEGEPTTLRLAEVLTSQRSDLVSVIMREEKLTAYSEIFACLVAAMPDMPIEVLRQRMVLVTRYLTSIFALYEEAQLDQAPARRRVLGAVHDLGNVIDTAVGIVEAPIVDGRIVHGR